MKYLLAAMIAVLWIYIALSFSWDPKSSIRTNLVIGFGAIILIGIIYWVPFWLIFVK